MPGPVAPVVIRPRRAAPRPGQWWGGRPLPPRHRGPTRSGRAAGACSSTPGRRCSAAASSASTSSSSSAASSSPACSTVSWARRAGSASAGSTCGASGACSRRPRWPSPASRALGLAAFTAGPAARGRRRRGGSPVGGQHPLRDHDRRLLQRRGHTLALPALLVAQRGGAVLSAVAGAVVGGAPAGRGAAASRSSVGLDRRRLVAALRWP